MFFEALKAATVLDSLFLLCSLIGAILLLIGVVICYRSKKSGFNYYSDFSKVFYAIAAVWFICGVLAIGLVWLYQIRLEPMSKVKWDKLELRNAVAETYNTEIKNAKTPTEKKNIKDKYTGNGFAFSPTGTLIVPETARVSNDVVNWLKMRDLMEKFGDCSIRIPGVKKISSRPGLNESINKKALYWLNIFRNYRYLVWGGVFFVACLIMAGIGFAVSRKGTATIIEDELKTL